MIFLKQSNRKIKNLLKINEKFPAFDQRAIGETGDFCWFVCFNTKCNSGNLFCRERIEL